MFDRVRMKEMAKGALKRRYWQVVLVAFLVLLLGGNLANGLTGVSVNTPDADEISSGWVDQETPSLSGNPWEDQGGTVWDNPNLQPDSVIPTPGPGFWEEFSQSLGIAGSMILGVLGVLLVLVSIGALVFTVFVSNVMTVGGHGWMLRHLRGEDVSAGEAFAGFRIYKPAVVTMLVRGIYIFLWSLLFIIPGIVKGYAYSMVPYIIYENPNISADEALRISNTMTKGYKMDLFVLNLSFIGWGMLSALTGGLVGLFYSNPYMGLTHAGAYEDLKWKAIQSGKLTWADFGQQPPSFDPFAPIWGEQNSGWAQTQQPYGGTY